MKLLYFTLADFAETCGGVYKKVLIHTKIFRQEGFEVDLIYKRDGLLLMNPHSGGEIVLGKSGKNFTRGFLDARLIKHLKETKYDRVFIRYLNTDAMFNRLLRICKKNGSKIMIEFPTYPYDEELKDTTVRRIRLMFDRLHRGSLKKYVDQVATYSADKLIYGIPAVKIVNGLDFANVMPVKPVCDSNHINLLAVSTMQVWHGYDRLLMGMAEYYQNDGRENVLLHMVGAGPDEDKYRRLVKDNQLEEHVIFYGAKTGDELEHIYDMCDIGVNSLGAHRIGISLISALKSREYAAKGIPMLTSCEIDVFPSNDTKFICRFPADETNIDIDLIVRFYYEMYGMNRDIAVRGKVIQDIREQARKKCDMRMCMEPILAYLRNEKSVIG